MNFLNDVFGPALVLDASVMINLIATEDPVAILGALPSATIVEQAAAEVSRDPRTRVANINILNPLLAGPLKRVALNEEEADCFVELVSASPPNDLDDGEAATIAYATQRGLLCVIDERKGHRILRREFDGCRSLTTVALYRELLGQDIFDRDFITICIFDSLRFARMRVVDAEMGWVRQLLSPEQLACCPSLRGHYRQ